MFYREIAPKGKLQSVVECFWALEHDYRDSFHTHEHLWAAVHSELIFSFGERYHQKTQAGKKLLPENFVIGPFRKKLMLYSDGFTGFVAVRFRPWGLAPFSLKPMAALVGAILPAEDVFGSEIRALVGKMQNLTREEKLDLLERHFQERLATINPQKMASARIGHQIVSKKGTVPISKLLAEFGINSRQLERVFRSETGLSPKMFSRIVRFNHAKRRIEEDPDISLAQLTYDCGYSDQAHFNKNFRELFDLTPADFKRQLKRFTKETADQIDVEFLQDRRL
jgi:AraC-like DNA-binding protein